MSIFLPKQLLLQTSNIILFSESKVNKNGFDLDLLAIFRKIFTFSTLKTYFFFCLAPFGMLEDQILLFMNSPEKLSSPLKAAQQAMNRALEVETKKQYFLE